MKTKFIAFVAMCLLASATVLAQTSEIIHKIARGETIESIAQKYGVTADDIKKANPNAGNYFYTGMSIKIPAKKVEVVETAPVKTAPVVELENETTDVLTSSTVETNVMNVNENVIEIDESYPYTAIGYWNYDDFENWGLSFGVINPNGWGFDFTVMRLCLKSFQKGGSGNGNADILPNYTFELTKNNKNRLDFTISAGPSIRSQQVPTGVTAGGNIKTKTKYYLDGYAQVALNAKLGPIFLSAGYNLWFPKFKTSSKYRVEGFVFKVGGCF